MLLDIFKSKVNKSYLRVIEDFKIRNMNWVANKKIKYKNIIEQIMENTCEKTNQYTNGGPLVKELENFIHKKFQIDEDKAVICCNNATSALYALHLEYKLYMGLLSGQLNLLHFRFCTRNVKRCDNSRYR